jgi:putative Mg2+ transporter-C (MgtC) family protein
LFDANLWIEVATAALCGGMVGLERQLDGKALGMRTAILVCLGTVVYVHVGIGLAGTRGDASRVVGQVVTGVGFLGAGVLFQRNGTVVGLTTAATVWLLAAIGVTIGMGDKADAIALAVVTVLVLRGLEMIEDRVPALAKGVHGRGGAGDSAPREDPRPEQ